MVNMEAGDCVSDEKDDCRLRIVASSTEKFLLDKGRPILLDVSRDK